MTTTKTVTIQKEIQQAVNEAIAIWEESRADGLSFDGAIAEQVLDPGDASDLVHAAIEDVIVPLGFTWDTGHGGVDHWEHLTAPVVVAFEWESLTVEVRVSDIFRRDPVGAFFERLDDDDLREVLAALVGVRSVDLAMVAAYWDASGVSFADALEDAPERYTEYESTFDYAESLLDAMGLPLAVVRHIDIEGFAAELTDVFEADGYVFKEC